MNKSTPLHNSSIRFKSDAINANQSISFKSPVKIQCVIFQCEDVRVCQLFNLINDQGKPPK